MRKETIRRSFDIMESLKRVVSHVKEKLVSHADQPKSTALPQRTSEKKVHPDINNRKPRAAILPGQNESRPTLVDYHAAGEEDSTRQVKKKLVMSNVERHKIWKQATRRW